MVAAEGSGPLITVDSDTEFAVVAAAGRRFGPDGFDVEKAVDVKVTATGAAVEVVAVAVARKTAWCPWSLSGHLARCQWLSMTGAAAWIAGESHLEIKQQRC